MSRCVLTRCYHCFTKSMLPRNESIAEKLCRKVRTRSIFHLPVCSEAKLQPVTTYGNSRAPANSVLLVQHRQMSDKTEEKPPPPSSFLSKLLDNVKAFMTRSEIETTMPIQHLQVGGTLLVLAISDYVSYEEFFEVTNLEDNFYSFYKVLELHLWMVLQRLQRDGNDGIVAGMALVNAMWKDLEPRVKLAGAQMKQRNDGFHYLHNHLQSAMLVYDEALLDGSDMELAHALWLNIYDGKDCDPRCLEFMVDYTRKQMNYLHSIDSKVLLGGQQVSFLPIELDEEMQRKSEEREYKIPRYTRKLDFKV
ncbi:ubiquinol-cytochrome-c reductase complex assembly factor 1-like [Ostrea edulis]|uniref:ubiquinol-cytochrome-c reductase complex assembly factor 1-like n=1 Tax=Ostrea edulis TaxID=37623 RepID=UPI0020957E33|nr:ubiquinol-cytochrome-c reductase complex assembly factor 1-like [Ostrea edulis]